MFLVHTLPPLKHKVYSSQSLQEGFALRLVRYLIIASFIVPIPFPILSLFLSLFVLLLYGGLQFIDNHYFFASLNDTPNVLYQP
jgi:hypothetical protein